MKALESQRNFYLRPLATIVMRLASKVIFFTSLGAEPQSQYLFTGVLGVLGALSGRDGIGSRTGVAGSRLDRTVVPTLGVRLGRRRDGALGFHILPTKLFMALHVVDVVVRLACISLAVSAMLTTLPVLNSAFLVSCSNFACMSSIAAYRACTKLRGEAYACKVGEGGGEYEGR